ncbi:efflux RND transporter permease subunit [Anatilimnocola floriformis]|uniref:efflux RND transporter permease subunit n=1 Tax=Anatilimnocola floriformis TaxID=2948575 RepID=UPI0020C3B58F|nr:MMPL family transporter [Anatilimnocola floriformis]
MSNPAPTAFGIRRWAVAILLAIGLLLPVTAFAVRAAIRSNANDVRDWLPAHFPETVQYRSFREQFGSEEFVVVSWPGCDLSDPRLEQLSEKLSERSAQSEAAGRGKLFVRSTTGRQMLAELMTRFSLKKDQAISRLKGTFIGPDDKQTCAIVTLSEESRRRLKGVLLEIRAAAVDVGVAAKDVHLGGPSVVNDAIDQSSSQSLVRLAALAGVVGLVVAWLCFREVRLTLIVFFIAGYSAALSLAVVPLCGVPLNAILITMVPLVYVTAMSGAIHLSNYYRESLQRLGSDAAIVDAIRHAALPLGLATTTTAIGLVSLWYSDLAPIRLFGVFSAIGVLIALAMQLIVLPALITVWPKPPAVSSASHRTSDEEALEIEPLSPAWQRYVSFITGYHRWLTLLFVLCLGGAATGLMWTTTSIQIMRLFAPSTPIIASYDWLEKNLGAMVPLEVVVRFDAQNQQTPRERLELVRELHDAISQTKGVSGCLSAATFTVKTEVRGKSVMNALSSVRLKHTQAHLKDAGYLASSEKEESWRISVRVTAGEDLDYGLFQQQLRAEVDPLLAREQAAGAHGISAIYTGAVPIVYKARRSLLDGLMLGFGTDVLLVVISVLLLLRNSSGGVLLFLTSIFPITIVFGLMGWFGWVIDIGSVMAPCVALGVSIDDAIHFLLRFRQAMDRGLSQRQAVQVAYAGCGQAMIQSWGVIALGLSVFALSQFIPTFRFGALTFALLTASTLCNLIFLPALLSGPLGWWLGRRSTNP